jgi:hypothetical protein
MDSDQAEPIHQQVIRDFAARRVTSQVPVDTPELYSNDSSMTQEPDKKFLDEFQRTQELLRGTRLKLAKRQAKAKAVAASQVDFGHVTFVGSVDKCIICIDNFVASDAVCRLKCRHVFHERCFKTYLTSAAVENVSCPECRGCSKDPKFFVFVSKEQLPAFTDTESVKSQDKNPGNPTSSS